MRSILLLIILISLSEVMSAQYVYTIKADSVKITNCDSSELIIENHTQGVPGFLFNTGNGRTVFRRGAIKLNDSMYAVGSDTVKIPPFFPAWYLNGNTGINSTYNFLGTRDTSSLIFKTNNTERARFSGSNGNLLVGTATDEGQRLQVNGDSKFNGGITQTSVSYTSPTFGVNHIEPNYFWNSNNPGYISGIEINTSHNFLQNTTIFPNGFNTGNAIFRLGLDAQAAYTGGDTINIIGDRFLENVVALTDMEYKSPYGNFKVLGSMGGFGSILNINGNPRITNYADFVSEGTFHAAPTDKDTVINRYGLYVRDLKADSSSIVYIGNTYPVYAVGPKDISYLAGNMILGGTNPPVNNGSKLQVNGTQSVSSNLGVGGITAMTAKVHISAGSATAGTAPLKFTSGPLLTTPEPGAVEFLTDKAYLGITTGAARKEFALWDATGNLTSVPFVTTNGRLTSSGKLTYNDGFAALSVSDAQYNTHATFNGVPQYDNNYGLRVWNTGAATSTQPAMSPGINYRGQAWSTNDGQSESVEFGSWIDTRNGPQAGGNWCLQSRVNYANNSFNFFYNKNFGVNNNGGILIYDKQSADMPNPTILFTDQNEFEEGRIDLRGNNIAIGAATGPVSPLNCYYNIMLGQSVGNNITTGTGNILIGNYINTPSATGSNTLDIGNIIYGTNLYNGIPFGVSANPSANGNIGIAITSPSARLQLPAGTSAGGTAPLKLTAGTVLSTPENGAIEYDGTNYYADASATRYTLAKTLTTTATLDFPGTSAQSSSDLTVTLNGVAAGDVVAIGPASAAVTGNSCFTAWVSAANTVTVRFNNYSTGTIDPASGSFRVSVIKY